MNPWVTNNKHENRQVRDGIARRQCVSCLVMYGSSMSEIAIVKDYTEQIVKYSKGVPTHTKCLLELFVLEHNSI